MDCGDCAAKIDKAVRRMPGVESVQTVFASSRLSVDFDPSALPEERIREQVRSLGYGIHDSHAAAQADAPKEPPARVLSIVAAGGLLLIGAALSFTGASTNLARVFYGASIILGGWPVFLAAWGSVRARVFGDINVLMSLAAIGAVFLGKWDEAATVFFLFALGEWLEAYTVDRTRGQLRGLMALAPPVARVLRDGVEVETPSRDIAPGTIIRLRPGERIALDGEVVGGLSSVNQAAVTGESIPVEKRSGDEVYAGTVNGEGMLDVRTTRAESESTVARIADMVQEAQARKAPTERYVDRFSAWYTPAVIAVAAGMAVFPPLLLDQPFRDWFYRALVLLVASCPCALVISTPVAIVSALGNAARRGILIKGGGPLELAAAVDTVAFDKTGTLTEGTPRVTEVFPAPGVDADALLSVAAALEAHSPHPLADAIRRHAREQGVTPDEVEHFRTVPGLGVSGDVQGVPFWIGSLASVMEAQVPHPALEAAAQRMEEAGQTVVAVSTRSGPLGLIAVMDRPRPGVVGHLESLREAGIRHIAMLTGDAPRAAAAVARQVGVDDVRAGLLPEHKRDVVAELERGGRVAMVGDGVNDAPALATATVGIAMGAVGSDAAVEAADIALMGDDLDHVGEALALSRRTMRVIRQNVAFSILVKAAFLVAVFTGHATLWMAVVADMGASILVTLNAMRLMRA